MAYSIKDYNPEHMARARAIALPISFKQSVEICNFIRNRRVNDAKEILMRAINKEEAIPFKRFNKDLGHKKNSGPGRYPVKSSREIMKLLEAIEANAQFKGLNTSDLVIKHICANKASKVWHFGRKRRRKAKRTHIEVVVEEKKKTESDITKTGKNAARQVKQNKTTSDKGTKKVAEK